MEATLSTVKCFWGRLLLCVPRKYNLISSRLGNGYVCMYVCTRMYVCMYVQGVS